MKKAFSLNIGVAMGVLYFLSGCNSVPVKESQHQKSLTVWEEGMQEILPDDKLTLWSDAEGTNKRTNEQSYGNGYSYESNGWRYIHIEGEPFERGEQYGYLAADIFTEGRRTIEFMTYQTTGMPYSFFVEKAVELTKGKIPAEYLEEMSGFAAGVTKAGTPLTLEDVIGWNAWSSVTGYWWPLYGGPFKGDAPKTLSQGKCSAFAATGSATKDGKVVIGHTTFDDFWSAGCWRIMLDIKPAKGNEIMMQTFPGYLISNSDWFLTGAGIVGLETTIVGLNAYDVNKTPEWVRLRNAMQYAHNLDEWVQLANADNNGANGACWLLADINTNEIARFEQGYIYQNYEKKMDGYFYGDNTPSDPRIRNLECDGTGHYDTRWQTGGRRARWIVLLDENNGRIDADMGKMMLGDTYDMYHKLWRPGATTICSMYDIDPRLNMSSHDAPWYNPYQPAGSLDAKLTTSDMASQMKTWARFGRANGVAFEAKPFLKEHPIWRWMEGYLPDRPSQPWTVFQGQ